MKTIKEKFDDVGVRPEVLRFAAAMEMTLRLNDDKGGWSRCPPEYLLSRMKDEMQELETALASPGEHAPIRNEAVDVANFAMMLYDIHFAPGPVKDEEKTIDSDGAFWVAGARLRALEQEREALRLNLSLNAAKIRKAQLTLDLAAGDFTSSRSLEEVRAEIEERCDEEHNWMDAPQYLSLPLEMQAMVVRTLYLNVTAGGHVRDDEEGLQTWADLWEDYERYYHWRQRKGEDIPLERNDA